MQKKKKKKKQWFLIAIVAIVSLVVIGSAVFFFSKNHPSQNSDNSQKKLLAQQIKSDLKSDLTKLEKSNGEELITRSYHCCKKGRDNFIFDSRKLNKKIRPDDLGETYWVEVMNLIEKFDQLEKLIIKQARERTEKKLSEEKRKKIFRFVGKAGSELIFKKDEKDFLLFISSNHPATKKTNLGFNKLYLIEGFKEPLKITFGQKASIKGDSSDKIIITPTNP